jgi:monomeric isocitrate dehydrogenase
MFKDKKLWKAARFSFHQLLMSSVLMDLTHKITFGKLMVQFYDELFIDFIDDDHEV